MNHSVVQEDGTAQIRLQGEQADTEEEREDRHPELGHVAAEFPVEDRQVLLLQPVVLVGKVEKAAGDAGGEHRGKVEQQEKRDFQHQEDGRVELLGGPRIGRAAGPEMYGHPVGQEGQHDGVQKEVGHENGEQGFAHGVSLPGSNFPTGQGCGKSRSRSTSF